MSRPFLPSAVLTALALTFHVRPRFMDEWPQLADANLVSRAGKPVVRVADPCHCIPRACCV
jgi:hypothetical protein